MSKSMLGLLEKQVQERVELQSQCLHPKESIESSIDDSYVGRGTRFPNIDVLCTRCGKSITYMNVNNPKKIIGILDTLEEVAISPEFRGERYRVESQSIVEVRHRGRLE